MGDEDIGEMESVAEIAQQIQHLCLHGYIECGDGFV